MDTEKKATAGDGPVAPARVFDVNSLYPQVVRMMEDEPVVVAFKKRVTLHEELAARGMLCNWCDGIMSRQAKESPSAFAKRQFCSRSCQVSAQNSKRGYDRWKARKEESEN